MLTIVNAEFRQQFAYWTDDLPIADAGTQSVSLRLPASRHGSGQAQAFAAEWFVPVGPRALYGLLGARLVPSAATELFVEARFGANGPEYRSDLVPRGSSLCPEIRAGLCHDYAAAVLEGVQEYQRLRGSFPFGGSLVFATAASDEMSSCFSQFRALAFLLVRLMLLDRDDRSEPTVLEAIKEATQLRHSPPSLLTEVPHQPEQQAPPTPPAHLCPCCGSAAITAPGEHGICPVCNRQDDPTQRADPTKPRRESMSLKLRALQGARLWQGIRERLEESDVILQRFEAGLTQAGPEFQSDDPVRVLTWLEQRTSRLHTGPRCWLVLANAHLMGVVQCSWPNVRGSLPSISRELGEQAGVLLSDGTALLIDYCLEEPHNKYQCYARDGDDQRQEARS
jgi:hypothetical protein